MSTANGRETARAVLTMWYTVADLVRLTGRTRRQVQWDFTCWRKNGWPLVVLDPTPCQGNRRGRYVVNAAEYHAVMRGELSQEPVAA